MFGGKEMNEKKMTDEEIIKALEVCSKEKYCGICAVRHFCEEIKLGALDLINRQKAEIERLTEELKYYRGELL